jgi:transposase
MFTSKNPHANLSKIRRGIYPLSKEPSGLYINTDHIVGIDPGVRDLITCTRSEQEEVNKSANHLDICNYIRAISKVHLE